MLQLRTLGGLGLRKRDSDPAPIDAHRKTLVLLAILAASGESGMSREKLMCVLWPESDAGHASGALRQMLHNLKKRLQITDVVLGAHDLRLNSSCIQSDIGQFKELLSSDQLTEAVEQYGGTFLDGIFLAGVTEFERWLDVQRNDITHRYAAALETLAKQADAAGDLPACVNWLRRLQALDECNGQVALRLITKLEQTGDLAGALQHVLTHEAAVRDELGTSPNQAVTAAATRLRKQRETMNLSRGADSSTTTPTHDAEAYDLYLKARYLWTKRTGPSLEQAVAYLHRAVERDPEFALAYVAMSDAYVNLSNFGHTPSAVALAHAAAAADRAITLDPSHPEPYASKGFVLTSIGKMDEAEQSFQKSIELNPSYPSARHYYTLFLTIMHRLEDADRENAIALRLNPLSLGANAHRGVLRLMRDDFSGARDALRHSLSLSPTFPLALAYLGDLDASQGRYVDSVKSLETARKSGPRFPGVVPALVYTYSRTGRTAKAHKLMSDLREETVDDRATINLALAHAMNGDMESSFSLIHQVRWDVPTRMALRASRLLEPLRSDPRYALLG